MDNLQIASTFSLLSKLLDIHGENSFKAKSYATAAFTIEQTPVSVLSLPDEKLFSLRGIGSSIGKQIIEIREQGRLSTLEEYLQKTPAGVLEMLQIKGLGPKKIAVVWKDMGLDDMGELLYACNENRLLHYKGFGEKTQQQIKANIEFYINSKGSYLYADIEPYAHNLETQLQTQFPEHRFQLTGTFARQLEIVDKLEWVTTVNNTALEHFLTTLSFSVTGQTPSDISFTSKENLHINFYVTNPDHFGTVLFRTSCSDCFLQEWDQQFPDTGFHNSEEAIFNTCGIPYLPPCRREKATVITAAEKCLTGLPLILPTEIKGVIHTHSNWSDGKQTLEEMAFVAAEKGFEYLVISDHSKSAFYANGLKEDRLKAQHLQIEILNDKLHPFKIFKSIEADILNDGSLDYSDGILSTFDLVIASVHSNLKMNEERAMQRLLTAIQNPYTTILGHLTGRLLLSRAGYPVDHKTIIDACAVYDVAIELNAHPRRLDIDWRWIDYALERGVLISINPDAHHTQGFNDIRYGVLAAQKAGVTRQNNLSSYNLQEFEAFLKKRKEKKGI